MDTEISFVHEHAEEKIQFDRLRCLIESIQSAGVKSSSSEFCMELCSHADQIMDSILKHFESEEVQVCSLLHHQYD